MKKESYQCSICLKTYLMGWSKEDAIAEKEKFFGDASLEECDVVCDDCFQRVSPEYNHDQYAAWKQGLDTN